MKYKLLTAILLLCALFSTAIFANGNVQFIHNAADPQLSKVDVYINGIKLFNDFSFRHATPFINVASGVTVNVGLAPENSSSVNDTVKNFPVMAEDGGVYVAMISGVLNPASFAPNPNAKPLELNVYSKSGAKMTAGNFSTVEFLVAHGVTDAPAVDIIANKSLKIVDNAAYGDITDYISVPPAKYSLDITLADDNSAIVKTVTADLSRYGGGTLFVFASGFLNPSANMNGPAFGVFAATPLGPVIELPAEDTPPVQYAKAQLIHNSPDPAAAKVDIYLNGSLLLNDFGFRKATPYIDLEAGVPLNIGIAPSNSASAADTVKNVPIILEANQIYLAVASGVIDPSAYAANPDGRSIDLTVVSKADMKLSAAAGTTEFVVLHGATDAPAVDVIARGVAKLVDNAFYKDITGYIAVPAASYIIDITPAEANDVIVKSVTADLSGLGGGTAVVFASGFLNPAANNNGAPFGIFAALTNGTVVEFPAYVPPPPGDIAKLQVIHNSADPAAALVDVYLNGSLLLDNFGFRTATPFIDAPAGVLLNIGIAPSASTSAADTLKNFPVTLIKDKVYLAVASGVVSPGDFAANPDAKDISLTLLANAGINMAAKNPAKAEFRILHGVTDAPTVDVLARYNGKLADNISYGKLTGNIAAVPTNFILDVTTADNSVVVKSFKADLTGLQGASAIVFASGFLDPAANQNGEPFGLFAALANGTVVELPEIQAPPPPVDETIAKIQIIHNSPDPAAKFVDIYLNGNLILDNFEFRKATPYLEVPANVVHNIGVAPGTSTSVNDTLKNFQLKLNGKELYIAVASGVLNPNNFFINPSLKPTEFTILTDYKMRTKAANPQKFEFVLVHGVTDAPAVDILARWNGKLADNLKYTDITTYRAVPPIKYKIDITLGILSTIPIKTFEGDFTALQGKSAVVFASGFLAPILNQNGPAFGLYAAFPDGNVVELPAIKSKLFKEGNELAATEYNLNQNYPNPFNPTTLIRYSVPEKSFVSLKVYDMLGRETAVLVNEEKEQGFYDVNFNASGLASGIYIYKIEAGSYTSVKKMVLTK